MKFNCIVKNPFLYKHNKYKQTIDIYIFFKRNITKQLINNKYNTLLNLLNNNIKDILKKFIDTFECKLLKSYLIIDTIEDDLIDYKINKI